MLDITQDIQSLTTLLEIAAHADVREGIRQGLEESEQGLGRDADEFFTEFEAVNAIELR